MLDFSISAAYSLPPSYLLSVNLRSTPPPKKTSIQEKQQYVSTKANTPKRQKSDATIPPTPSAFYPLLALI